MKTEIEIRAKLAEMLAIDCWRGAYDAYRAALHHKVAACKALLWALGEDDDNRWYIRAEPGPPVNARFTNP